MSDPRTARAGPPGPADELAVTIGDIVGHNIQAAAVMGQVRSMLRQADVQDNRGPAAAVVAVETACNRVSLDVFGTIVHAHLRAAESGTWRLTWTNAGHPPPLLLSRGSGQVEILADHDLVMWSKAAGSSQRADHDRILSAGDTLLLYTDGLVERRDGDIDEAIGAVAAILSSSRPRVPLAELIDEIVEVVAVTRQDDIALLALRLPDTPAAG